MIYVIIEACGSTYINIYHTVLLYGCILNLTKCKCDVRDANRTSSAPNSMAQTMQVDAESPSGHFIDFGLEATSSRRSCASDACAKWDRTLFATGPSTYIASF